MDRRADAQRHADEQRNSDGNHTEQKRAGQTAQQFLCNRGVVDIALAEVAVQEDIGKVGSQPHQVGLIQPQLCALCRQVRFRCTGSQNDLCRVTWHKIHDRKNRDGNANDNRDHQQQPLSDIFTHLVYLIQW